MMSFVRSSSTAGTVHLAPLAGRGRSRSDRVRGTLHDRALGDPPLYLHGQDLCDGSDLASWPVATGQDAWRCRPFPLRLQPWVSFGIFAMSRTTEQSLEFRSHGQGRLP